VRAALWQLTSSLNISRHSVEVKGMQIGIETVALMVTIALAFVGYLATYLNNLAISRRSERLQLVTSRLNESYGPLFVITQTGNALFQALQTRAAGLGWQFINEDAPLNADAMSEWRVWVEEVFIPINEPLQQILIQKAHLIREEDMPAWLKAFSAHHAGYKVLVRKWRDGNFSETTPLVPYPAELIAYAEQSYRELKQEQMRMIAYQARRNRRRQTRTS
jgi:hypothetical protein